MTHSGQDVVVAVDVGGTSFKCALVSTTGKVLQSSRRITPRVEGPEAIVKAILDTVTELATTPGYRARAVGLAVPGVIDEPRGIAVYASNLGWRNVPFRSYIEERLQVPVALGHDIRAGGVAEARFGAGRHSSQLFFIAIGTGIAGAHIVNGRTIPGARGSSCEIGHVVVRPDGPLCGCGQRGCVEALASAVSVERRYAELSGTLLSGAEIVAARHTDRTAGRVWDETVDVLSDGLLVALAMLDPDTIVIGGGLAQAGDALFVPLEASLRDKTTFHAMPRIIQAELGDEAGCVGASLLALDRLKENKT